MVDQGFGVGGTGARCGGAPQVPFTQVNNNHSPRLLLAEIVITVNTSGVLEGTEVREGYRKFGSRVYRSSGGGTEVRESSFFSSFQKNCP